MTIRTLANDIAEDAKGLRNRGQTDAKLQQYAEFREAVSRLIGLLRSLAEGADVLKAVGIDVRFGAAPQQAIETIRGLTPDGGTLVDNPMGVTRSAFSELNGWAKTAQVAIRDAYQAWFEATFPDLDAVERLVPLVQQFDDRGAIALRTAAASARAKRSAIPASRDDFQATIHLADRLTELVASIAPSGRVLDDLRAVLGQGLPITDLSAEFEAWAIQKRLWPSLRVRLDR